MQVAVVVRGEEVAEGELRGFEDSVFDGGEFVEDEFVVSVVWLVGIPSFLSSAREKGVAYLGRSLNADSTSNASSSFPLRISHLGDSGSSRIVAKITSAKRI